MRFYLIRHGQTDWNVDKRVMGKRPVSLNSGGKESVRRTAEYLRDEGIEVIFSSTLRRAVETSGILSEFWGAEVKMEERLDESAFEEWTGRTYGELQDHPDFILYRNKPSLANFSRGEGMMDIQDRAVAVVKEISGEGSTERVALVSHSDVIKPVLSYYLGMDLNHMHRLAISNASITLLEIHLRYGPRVRYLNLVP